MISDGPLLLYLRLFGLTAGTVLFLFLLLMGISLVSVFVTVNAANRKSATRQIAENLDVSGRVFHRLIRARSQQLAEGAYVLSSDFAFKRAIATGEHATILSALGNLESRIEADAMALVSVDYLLTADTLRLRFREHSFERHPKLIRGLDNVCGFLGESASIYQIIE